MRIRAFQFFCASMLALFVSVGSSHAQSSLDTRGSIPHPGGSIIPGYDSRTCTGSISGAIRYNSASSCVEFCNGSGWTCPGNPSGSSIICHAPPLCPNIGDVCDDGDAGTPNDPLFAGFMVYNDPNSADVGKCKPLFVSNNNQSTSSRWKTSHGANDIAIDSWEDGRINDSQIANSTTFPAFKLCKDLTHGGFTDWYLPAQDELHLLWKNRAAINANAAGNFTTSDYWSSTELNLEGAKDLRFSDGLQWEWTKTSYYDVRCVRRD